MINVKLLVLFICVNNICGCRCDYCKICPSHTLCIYKRPGPGPYCRSYDKKALITKEDVETIVNKINQRRNFVALGLARNLPSAANMNEMRWSEELAISAQRWADQCDPAVRPDRKDLCRDLVDNRVGQSIATVMGLSPGLSVKSFVEMWYMQALDYNGSVTYYNQSEGRKTDDFTQLIWAETTLVGCGKARFNIDDKGTMIERFVCNFAPKANVRGKPVYTIGYPATQCKENSHKDERFTGLCKAVTGKPQRTTPTTENSPLRNINLPKNPVKLDMDPLRVDYKNREMKHDRLKFMRHQNLRHIPNSTRGLVHHITPARQQNIQESPNTAPWQDVIARQNVLGHSQNIYGAFYRTRFPIEHYRRNDYMRDEANPNYYDINLEPLTFDQQCTRKSEILHNDNACQYASEMGQHQCTRKAKEKNEYILTSPSCKKKDHATINVCDSQKLTCMLNPVTTVNNCNYNCHCLNIKNPGSENRRRLPGEYVYYDYLPNLALRGGVEFDGRHPTQHHRDSNTSLLKYQSTGNFKGDYSIHDINIHKQITNTHRSLQKNYRNYHPYFVNPRERSKRQTKTQYSDLWKEDESLKRSKRNPRYTTLRSNIKSKFRKFGNFESISEPITIPGKDFNEHRHGSADRSLSFDELMNFRKNRGGEIEFNIRRKNKNDKKTAKPTITKPKTTKPTTTKSKTTKPPNIKRKLAQDVNEKVTANATVNNTQSESPPTKSSIQMTIIGSFSPQSACTRRITCTWTMPKMTDANGNIINPGGAGGGGGNGGGGGFPNGRTPWGHVENCTRRYTCSRIFYNRNVQASDTAAGETTLPDEDYCERRALDVRLKDLHETGTVQPLHRYKHSNEPSLVTPSMKYESTGKEFVDCLCNEQKPRKKRSHSCKHKEEKEVQECKSKKKKNILVLALSKILQSWENNRNKHRKTRSECYCNTSVPTRIYSIHMFLLFFILIHLLN